MLPMTPLNRLKVSYTGTEVRDEFKSTTEVQSWPKVGNIGRKIRNSILNAESYFQFALYYYLTKVLEHWSGIRILY